jgi:outer membrane biosynthesis protein TonB
MFDKISVQISVDMTNPHRPYLKIDCVSPPIGTWLVLLAIPLSSSRVVRHVVLLTQAQYTAELLGGISAAPPPERMDEDEEEEDEEEDESEETKVGGETKKRKEPPTQPKQVQKTKAKAKGAAVPRPSKKHREGQ